MQKQDRGLFGDLFKIAATTNAISAREVSEIRNPVASSGDVLAEGAAFTEPTGWAAKQPAGEPAHASAAITVFAVSHGRQ